MNKCKVVFVTNKQTFLFASELSLENSVQLALNLHRASNVSHHIDVFEDDRRVCSFVSQNVSE